MPQESSNQVARTSFAARIYRGMRATVAVPLLVAYVLSNEKELIRVDCERWIELLQVVRKWPVGNLLFLLGNYKEFRTLYYYRVGRGNLVGAAACLLLQALFKGEPTLHLRSPQIGPGFFMQHGYATSVGAYRIGKNCSVNQLVVIGWTDRTRGPILGDNVSVKAGAKILGPITLGNNVTVGANAVVTKDVPANCVVVGVPARIIRRNGVRVDEPLPSRMKAEDTLSVLLSLNEQIQSKSTALDFDDTLRSGCGDCIPEAERAGNAV
ncbi:MAG: serine O-acetyltransferase [Bryobacteraceae bacterium]